MGRQFFGPVSQAINHYKAARATKTKGQTLKEKKSTRKKLAIGASLVVSLFLLLFVAAYFYIQSNHFETRVELALADATGDQVEIQGQLEVEQMVPALKLFLPAIKLQSSNPASPYERLRVDELKVTMPTRMLTDGFQSGQIDLNFKNLSMVSRTANAPAADTESIGKSLSDNINEFRQQYPELEVSAIVDHVDYITRDGENLHYQLDDLVVSIATNEVVLAGKYLHDDDSTDQFSVQLNDLSPPASSASDQLTGNFIASVIRGEASKDDVDSGKNLSAAVLLRGDSVEFTEVNFTSPGIWARGDFSVEPVGKKTKMKADLELRKLEISSLFQSGQSDEDVSTSHRLFTHDPLDLNFTEQLDVDARIYLGAVRLNNEPVINGQLNFAATDGQIELSGEDLTLLGGESDLSLALKQPGKKVEMRFKLSTEDMQLDRIRVDRSNAAVLDRGEGDIIIALRGEGNSTADMAASLDGYLTAAVSGAFVKRKYVSLIDQGIVSWARNKISLISKKWKSDTPSVSEGKGLAMECASIRLFINDGRVEVSNGAIIEMPENTLVSSGYIDLHSEQLGFVFRAKRESLFDWSAISIVKFLEIDGSLANPGFGLDLGALAKQGVLSTTSLVYGPLPSLVYSLAEAGLKGRESIHCISDID